MLLAFQCLEPWAFHGICGQRKETSESVPMGQSIGRICERAMLTPLPGGGNKLVMN